MKKEKVQAYVTPDTKKVIVEKAKQQKCSESYIAGLLLDSAINSEQAAKPAK